MITLPPVTVGSDRCVRVGSVVHQVSFSVLVFAVATSAVVGCNSGRAPVDSPSASIPRSAAQEDAAGSLAKPNASSNKSANNAQPTATLAETLSWLKDRVAADGGYSSKSKYVHGYRPTDFSTCTISWMDFSKPVLPHSSKTTVALADIDPTAVKAEGFTDEDGKLFRVRLKTKSRKSIKAEESFGTFMMGSVNLIFSDGIIAERVAKAIAHAATLCGKEPF